MPAKRIVVLLLSITLSLLFFSLNMHAASPDSNEAPFDSESPKKFHVSCATPKNATSMPPVISIDGIPMCGVAVAQTLYLQNSCKREGSDCQQPDPKKYPSLLSLRALADEGEAAQNMSPAAQVNLKKNNPLSIDGGQNPDFVLKQAENAKAVFAASCYRFDQFVDKYDGSYLKVVRDSNSTLVNLKIKYDRLAELEARGTCIECLNDLVNELKSDFTVIDGLSGNIRDLQSSISQKESFDQFLHRYLIGNCKTVIPFEPKNYVLWPRVKSVSMSNDEVLAQANKILSTGTPFGLNVCANEIPTGDPKTCAVHSVVVSGFQHVCKTSQQCSSARAPSDDCRDLLHVQNAWGKDWQEKNNDGWVDAKTLLDHADVGRTSQLLYFTDPDKGLN